MVVSDKVYCVIENFYAIKYVEIDFECSHNKQINGYFAKGKFSGL